MTPPHSYPIVIIIIIINTVEPRPVVFFYVLPVKFSRVDFFLFLSFDVRTTRWPKKKKKNLFLPNESINKPDRKKKISSSLNVSHDTYDPQNPLADRGQTKKKKKKGGFNTQIDRVCMMFMVFGGSWQGRPFFFSLNTLFFKVIKSDFFFLIIWENRFDPIFFLIIIIISELIIFTRFTRDF